MITHSEKETVWTGKDYARTAGWFVFHSVMIALLFAVVFMWKYDFDAEKAAAFFERNGAVKNAVFLAFTCLFMTACMYLYFFAEHSDFILKTSNVNLTFLILEVSLAVTEIVGKTFSVFARPFALCALLSLLLIDRKSAIFMNVVSCVLVFMADLLLIYPDASGRAFCFSLVTGLFTGILAIFLVNGISSRLKVFVMGFILALPVIADCFIVEFDAFSARPASFLLWGASAGLLSVALMMAFVPFFEAAFKVLTVYRLAEITDHKSKLIRALIENAPGTFNHSLVVSTLSESCATAIGENPLLARACAYYHDIGKLKQPEFFTENQQGYNPHDELTPELSTDIIRSHAKDGYDLIKKYRLPDILADVALEHHGTMPIRYFYAKAKKLTEGELEVANFSYRGPKPQTKIAAIIMIADGCEAKVRTISDRSHENVDEAVKDIIEERMDLGQFDECELTMKDLDLIRRTLTNSLAGVYHDRVEYPKLRIGRREMK